MSLHSHPDFFSSWLRKEKSLKFLEAFSIQSGVFM